jgi:RNA polymerase sigma-70 factor (ECF subfamily)
MRPNAEEIVTQFAPALGRIAASYERNPALRDELLQEVLLAVITSLPRLTDADKLKPYVFRIAHNRCVSHVAQRMREHGTEEYIDDVVAEVASQEQVQIARERSERLLDAVRRLGLPYRQVVTLLLEDLDYEEIAETLGISVSNVGVRVNRAKQQLKAMLHDDR